MSYRAILQHKKGFTLVEVIVAIGIFTMIVSVGVGALINMHQAYLGSRSQRSSMDAISYILESMARELRTGSLYHCGLTPPQGLPNGTDCSRNPSSSISFFTAEGAVATYHLSNGIGPGGAIMYGRTDDLQNIQNHLPYPVTDTNLVDIEALDFYLVGAQTSDEIQPSITIVVRGKTLANRRVPQEFSLQTTVSQRLLDI